MFGWLFRKPKPEPIDEAAIADRGKDATAYMAASFASSGIAVDGAAGKGPERYFILDPKARTDVYFHGFVSGWAKALQKLDPVIGGLSERDYTGFIYTMFFKLFGETHLRTVVAFIGEKAFDPEYQEGVREGFAEASARILNRERPNHLMLYLMRRVREEYYGAAT